MKNYDELTNDLLERRNQYVTKQKKRKRVMKKVIMAICCFCLVTLIGVGLWQGDFFNTSPPTELGNSTHIDKNDIIDSNNSDGSNIDYTESSNTQDSNSSNSDANTNAVNRPVYYINEIKNTVSAAPKYLDPAEHYEETWDADKTALYLGVYLNNIRRNGLNYQGDGSHKVTYKNNGELARDIISFEYSFQDTKVIVSTSKLSYPYDCLYSLDEKITTYLTEEAVPVIFIGTKGTIGDNNEVLQELMVADFEYDGVKYRVKAENISPVDFYKIVVSVITG